MDDFDELPRTVANECDSGFDISHVYELNVQRMMH